MIIIGYLFVVVCRYVLYTVAGQHI